MLRVVLMLAGLGTGSENHPSQLPAICLPHYALSQKDESSGRHQRCSHFATACGQLLLCGSNKRSLACCSILEPGRRKPQKNKLINALSCYSAPSFRIKGISLQCWPDLGMGVVGTVSGGII